MSFSQKTWKDRDVQYPGKRTLTNINDNSDFQDVIVERAEGTVTEVGDLFCATKMNSLEQRLADAFAEVFNMLQEEVNQVYPVGAIYQSFDRRSPEDIFPGTTWVSLYDKQLKVGRVPLLVPTNEASGQNRGNTGYNATRNQYSSKQVTVSGTIAATALSNSQIPPHRHTYVEGSYGYGYGPTYAHGGTSYYNFTDQTYTEYAGKGYGHTHNFNGSGTFTEDPITIDIRQQYITMYAWRRTA